MPNAVGAEAASTRVALLSLSPCPATTCLSADPLSLPPPHPPAGTDIYLNAFFIPLGVVIYTAHGGLRGTYIASWAHVAVIYIALCVFMFLIYGALLRRAPAYHCHVPAAFPLPACWAQPLPLALAAGSFPA